MAKINPWNLPRPAIEKKTVTATDPNFPDTPLVLTLKPLGIVGQAKAHDIAQDLIAKYVDGDMVFPAVGGQGVDVSRNLCNQAAAIFVMQCPDDPKDAYTPEELIAFTATMEFAWEEIGEAAGSINEATLGNATRAVTTLLSEPPSSMEKGTPS